MFRRLLAERRGFRSVVSSKRRDVMMARPLSGLRMGILDLLAKEDEVEVGD